MPLAGAFTIKISPLRMLYQHLRGLNPIVYRHTHNPCRRHHQVKHPHLPHQAATSTLAATPAPNLSDTCATRKTNAPVTPSAT